MWEMAPFSIPWLCLLLNHKAYLITEFLLSGNRRLFNFLIPGGLLVVYHSGFSDGEQLWNYIQMDRPLAAILVPMLIKLYAPSTDLMLMMEHVAFAFALGFAFHLLMANYRQNEIIRTHNTILEQYLSQVERVTPLEERERVSKERMIRWAIRIRRSLWAWKRAFHGNQCGTQRKLSNLLELTRRSLDEVRGYLHELDSPQEQLPWCSH